MKVADLTAAAYDAQALRLLPETMARRFNAVPLSFFEGHLALAMVNPLDTLACDLIQARTGARLERMVATERAVRTALDRFYQQLTPRDKAARGRLLPTPTAAAKAAEAAPPEEIEIVHVDELLTMMMERKASDLHLSANAAPSLRIDGELVPISAERLGGKQVHELDLCDPERRTDHGIGGDLGTRLRL